MQIPILGDLFCLGEALFLRAGPAVLAGEIAGALFLEIEVRGKRGVGVVQPSRITSALLQKM